MAGMFEFGLGIRDIVRLRKFFQKSPKQFAFAARNVINELALTTRREGLAIIQRQMTIRNERFVRGSLWAELQRGNPPLKDVVSRAGSIERGRGTGPSRFTGWREQERGSRGIRERQPTLAARMDNESRAMFAGARMRPNRQIPSPNKRTRSNWNFADTPHFSRAQIMIMTLARQGYRGPFIIENHPSFPEGMYRFKGKKGGRRRIRLLQLFTVRKPRPRRVRWLSGGTAAALQDGRELWGRAVRRALPKRLR
jgi:hypothetical protein